MPARSPATSDRSPRNPPPLTARAADLKRRFNEDFWVDTDHGDYFALGLDHNQKRFDGVGSNMGHCLLPGLYHEEKAPHLAPALLSDTLSPVSGVRTRWAASRGANE